MNHGSPCTSYHVNSAVCKTVQRGRQTRSSEDINKPRKQSLFSSCEVPLTSCQAHIPLGRGSRQTAFSQSNAQHEYADDFRSGAVRAAATGGCSSDSKDRPTVTSPSGTFAGSLMTSRRDRTVYAFRGIRYAKPPVGQLRFKPPKFIEKYPKLVDATEDGPGCPQPAGFVNMSEDCLRLNVYSPHLPKSSKTKLLPVLVYLHPGGFYSVSGQSMIVGPQYMLDHDVVLVTVNYRLGTLGMLATGDKNAPGNNGLKDQVVALRWIQRNIRAFGGDPDSVTISGYSAGGISVGLHMLSPMSRGLFHRVISMSGPPTAQWDTPPHQRHLAEKQAQLVGCPTDSIDVIVNCLRTTPWEDLGYSLNGFAVFGWDPVLRWRPVVEPDLGQPRFLPATPEQLISEGHVVDVPIIMGITEYEFLRNSYRNHQYLRAHQRHASVQTYPVETRQRIFNLKSTSKHREPKSLLLVTRQSIIDVLTNDTLLETMERNWTQLAPISFQYDLTGDRAAEAALELRRAYIGDRPFTYNNDTAFALGRLYGDALISFGVHRFSRLMSQRLSSPVYYYKFNYTGTSSHLYYPGTTTPIGPRPLRTFSIIYKFKSLNRVGARVWSIFNEVPYVYTQRYPCSDGAVHHDDLIYLYHGPALFPYIGLDSPHSNTVDRMTTMWTNFATRGDPNRFGDQPALEDLDWPKLEPNTRKYLQINQHEFKVLSHMYEDRFAVWERLFPL
ncbi:Esterase FE4 [Eumeta japonica]|uniref:Esterase FE4 n=1 Tax=Eumeta variegata TaxID=151549 RepID=A0A4C1XQE4_EUMVA|nr:Esterase FE4 [Eumeta japonica]